MRVLCTLPNASTSMNGFPFQQTEEGMLSEDLPADVAARFLAVPGFVAVPARGRPPIVETAPSVAAASTNMNSATAEEISTGVKGIGRKIAAAIVAEREASGPFSGIEDLARRVRGAGVATLKANAVSF
jgi:competence ComEA-like helix-hairpin-helix protein